MSREQKDLRGVGLTPDERERVTTICLIYETYDAARRLRDEMKNSVYGQLILGLN
jgi:hypothetical protein